MNKSTMIEHKGFFFSADTPQEVMDFIARNHHTERFRFIYGDAQTGEAWISEEDAKAYGIRAAGDEGYIGRTTGTQKIPIAVYNERSMGGGAISTDCIVRIETCKGKRVQYTHPNFHYKPA
jgi:hypothetical protein